MGPVLRLLGLGRIWFPFHGYRFSRR
jgi:hypothetical protein